MIKKANQYSYNKLVFNLLGMSRFNKTLFVMFSDYLLLVLSFWVSLSIRANGIYIPTLESNALILLGPFIAIPIFYFFGLYRSLIRYSNYQSLMTIMLAVSCYTLVWFLLVMSVNLLVRPYDFLIINWLVTIFLTGGIRYIGRWFLSAKAKQHSNIIIYGAGESGIQLISAMKYNPEMKVIAFIDDDLRLQGRYIEGIKVYKASALSTLIDKYQVNEILIAIPSISKNQKHKLLGSLKQYNISIRALPSIADLAQGRVTVSDLKKIKIEDLLRRDTREPIDHLLKQDIEQKNILVTGAGGSIGSELCLQIIRLNPKLLILFEISEIALYSIERQLIEINSNVPILAVIGNVTRQSRLEQLIQKYAINTVYHAAAYKHVPLVEKNTVAGIRCNIFGTLSCIKAAINGDVESFVFISTDKAVRPTSVMGATKRLAELILQAFANSHYSNQKDNETRISIVRFGNVLDSSGSVVPLFREQIEKGGPITVTHPKIIRYFMTITEAAQLVIQAGSMGSSSDVFVLDMGEQLNVLDLAKDMIRLSGMTQKDENNPDGDIEIIITGLREGEKLYEELLIDDAEKTEHKKIMRAKEKEIEWEVLEKYLSILKIAIEQEDFEKVREVFLKVIPEYDPQNTLTRM